MSATTARNAEKRRALQLAEDLLGTGCEAYIHRRKGRTSRHARALRDGDRVIARRKKPGGHRYPLLVGHSWWKIIQKLLLLERSLPSDRAGTGGELRHAVPDRRAAGGPQ